MRLLAEIIQTIKALPGMALRTLVGVVIMAVLLMFIYNYSDSGSWVRAQVDALGEKLLSEAPALPGSNDSKKDDTNGSTDSEDDVDPVVRPMKNPSESSWFADTPSSIDTSKLNTLTVEEPYAPYEYDRDYFGSAWSDVDHNGCDTRNDILGRDLENVTYKSGTHDCVVQEGTFGDPYTGNILAFDKGTTSRDIDIEHIIALDDAWDAGAWEWTHEQRLAYANDPFVLAVVDGPTNSGKGSDSIGHWQPPYEASRCAYGARTVEIASKYKLTISPEDKQ